MIRVALFGGAFDPPTLGHQEMAKVLSRLDFVDQTWVVPCLEHPFGKKMAPFEARVEMCEAAFGKWQKGGKVCVETFLPGRLKSERTFDVLAWLENNNKFVELDRVFMPVIGLDEANDIHHWHRWEELVDQYKFIVFERLSDTKIAGPLELHYWKKYHHYVAPSSPIPFTSSTAARHNIAYLGDEKLSRRWKTIDEMYEQELSGLVSREVFDVAVANGLYGSQTPVMSKSSSNSGTSIP